MRSEPVDIRTHVDAFIDDACSVNTGYCYIARMKWIKPQVEKLETNPGKHSSCTGTDAPPPDAVYIYARGDY
jgi:hypothetical protein